MKILWLSFFYPPYQCIGAVRAGKLTKWLLRAGADVRVVSAAPQPLPATLPCEIPEAHVLRTRWRDLDAWARRLVGGGSGGGNADGMRVSRLEAWYRALWHWPDGQRGWVRPAFQETLAWLGDWRPDVIYASAWPVSAFLLARRLARALGCPWVAEYRDLWSGNHYLDILPAWRRRLDAHWETRLLRSASGIVTVSEPLAARLRAMHGLPVAVIPNGWDPDDLPVGAGEERGRASEGRFRIVYTGLLYGEQRDVSPLLAAMRALPEVQVELYGRQFAYAEAQARRFGVADRVHFHPPVPREEALALQRGADALLLALWNDPREKGVYTGKLFEYLAAGRPILAIGPKDNVAAELIQRLGAGAVASSEEEVQAVLGDWLARRRRGEALAGASRDAIVPWSHAALARRLLTFLKEVA